MKILKHSELDNQNRTLAGLIFILALLVFCGACAVKNKNMPVVTICVNTEEMRVGEEVPELSVTATADQDADLVLDRKTGYTLQELLKDLEQGKGILFHHEIDSSVEGTYEVEVTLDEKMKEKFSVPWSDKIKCELQQGSLTVKNQYGDWNGRSFQFVDGTKAFGWTHIGEELYYFDDKGECAAGELDWNGYIFYFTEEGVFDTEKNRIDPTKPMLALTFDDGPGRYTMDLLEILEQYDAKATFYMLGTCVENYPETVAKMAEQGHELGNHTTNHPNLTKLKKKEIRKELKTTDQAVEKITGQTTTSVRPPFGAVNSKVRNTVETPIVLWSVDTLDWENQKAKKLKKYVIKNVQDGDIVLMHDIYKSTVRAVEQFLPELVEQGYQFVTVSELAQIRGVTMEGGKKYFSFYPKNEEAQ